MIGVDIVDLQNPRTHRRHLEPRFLNRIFSAEEQELIRGSAEPELMLWYLWAMKEAAFKAIGSERHPAPPPVFKHPDFRAQLRSGALAGRVVWKDREVRTRLHTADDAGADNRLADDVRADCRPAWCAATARVCARTSEASCPHHRVESVASVAETLGLGDDGDPGDLLSPREQASVHSRASALVRLAARGSLAAAGGIAQERLEIVAGDHPGGRTPPMVLLDGSETDDLQVTLSHDGPWIAWGWRVTARRLLKK